MILVSAFLMIGGIILGEVLGIEGVGIALFLIGLAMFKVCEENAKRDELKRRVRDRVEEEERVRAEIREKMEREKRWKS